MIFLAFVFAFVVVAFLIALCDISASVDLDVRFEDCGCEDTEISA